MLWTDEAGRSRRPVVVIEDHLYHTGELLDAVAAISTDAVAQIAVCALDRPGPDTNASIADWAARFPGAEVFTLEDFDVSSQGAFARDIASRLRPGGVLVQDVQLETLPFIPADRWWESIYLGATIRGLFATRPPVVRFCSNKRGYDATFGRDLLEAGFDPREVMDKTDIPRVVAPTIVRLIGAQFPRTLSLRVPAIADAETRDVGGRRAVPVSDGDRLDVEAASDLVLWRTPAGATLGGRAVAASTPLRAGVPEIETWHGLITNRINDSDGIPVVDLGRRIAEPGAERAELTNIAARHIHTLRARLRDADAIVTRNHRYLLAETLTVAVV